ncbi:pyridoxal phosphate-dependent aminotransferase [Candidatus Vondammii sp. HM_W22]|uniref:pyridoxal phosphate-dependent aminotransferase n=1 Tax=Candidatus Vondammii sp. HM_W22 TaxID=2687299 RepID=UPI001F132B7F|nr:aminotransferase class I/II-fold pyridoxal phosphate-dependent enzyme [Candidatus Vondammii sp. HM_W22]
MCQPDLEPILMALNAEQYPDVHLNLNVRGLEQSATLAISERCAQLRKEGRDVYRLGLGQPPFPVAEPVIEELRANAYQREYLPVKGLPALREAVARYHRRQEGIEYAREDVLIGPGSKELMFLIQLVYYGDLVIPTPSWVSYAPQATIIGRHIRWVPTKFEDGWRITPEGLGELCHKDPTRPRILILNYPNNPSGTTYGNAELQELAKVARRYKIILLSDEIYGETQFNGKHQSIARYYPEGTIISAGLSKWCGAGGWRLGTFTFPNNLYWLLDAVSVVASETFTSTSAPIQHAAVRAYEGGIEIERYLWNSRRILKALGTSLAARLQRIGVDVPVPEGGFYLFASFNNFRKKLEQRGITTDTELCNRLLEETGVAVLPGSQFGRPAEELTARIAFVDFDGARALVSAEAVPLEKELSEDFVSGHCNRVVVAVEHLCAWLENGEKAPPDHTDFRSK